jgi:hypothetical protein
MIKYLGHYAGVRLSLDLSPVSRLRKTRRRQHAFTRIEEIALVVTKGDRQINPDKGRIKTHDQSMTATGVQ